MSFSLCLSALIIILSFSNGFNNEILMDAGFGFRLSKDLLGKNWYVRVDFPFWIKEGKTSSTDYDKFVFSFQRSI